MYFIMGLKMLKGNEIPMTWTLSDNFDWVNGGWKTDEKGDSYFCVKAGTFVDINYSLFNDNNTVAKTNTAGDGSIIYSKGNGKEFKIVFKTQIQLNLKVLGYLVQHLPQIKLQ